MQVRKFVSTKEKQLVLDNGATERAPSAFVVVRWLLGDTGGVI